MTHQDAEWQDLMQRKGYIYVSKKALPAFWEDIQTNPELQVVVFSVERQRDDGSYIIGGCSKMFRVLNEGEVAPHYSFSADFDDDIYINGKARERHMTENTELAERINSIVSQVTSLIAIYGKPGADSAAAGREVEQMLNEAFFSVQDKAKREKALAELTALSQELGMYDDDEPNPLIKHKPQPDPLAVTKRLLR